MGESDVGNDTVDRAMRLLVYGPLGLACYLKDSAPTFSELFVSRGKREFDGVRRTVEEKLGFATAPPEPAPSPSPQQRMADSVAGLSKIAAQATAMAASVAGPAVKAGAGAAANVASQAARTMSGPNGSGSAAPEADVADATAGSASAPAGAPGDQGAPSTGASSATASAADPAGPAGAGSAGTDAGALPISGYDGLSASQIIERLDGMSRGALERVRVYELAHRARRTILASIDNLTS